MSIGKIASFWPADAVPQAAARMAITSVNLAATSPPDIANYSRLRRTTSSYTITCVWKLRICKCHGLGPAFTGCNKSESARGGELDNWQFDAMFPGKMLQYTPGKSALPEGPPGGQMMSVPTGSGLRSARSVYLRPDSFVLRDFTLNGLLYTALACMALALGGPAFAGDAAAPAPSADAPAASLLRPAPRRRRRAPLRSGPPTMPPQHPLPSLIRTH